MIAVRVFVVALIERVRNSHGSLRDTRFDNDSDWKSYHSRIEDKEIKERYIYMDADDYYDHLVEN
ncbi:MAG: hypothetical protein CL609_24125 [Anaerolineaceae bacterium]|nr:hypothetical protein [Anaerolineaceae bacterium]